MRCFGWGGWLAEQPVEPVRPAASTGPQSSLFVAEQARFAWRSDDGSRDARWSGFQHTYAGTCVQHADYRSGQARRSDGARADELEPEPAGPDEHRGPNRSAARASAARASARAEKEDAGLQSGPTRGPGRVESEALKPRS